jgi:lipoprotein-anchoring transpeptidase ErfK/SrfK
LASPVEPLTWNLIALGRTGAGGETARPLRRPLPDGAQAQRLRGHRRWLTLTTCSLLALVSTCTATAHSTSPPGPQSTQALARLLTSHEAFAEPAQGSTPITLVDARRPLTGEQTVLPVLGRREGAHEQSWLHVMLPGRPNGHTGWIKQAGTVSSTTRWRIVVDTSTRRVSVYQDGKAVRTFTAVVGKPSTPTPHGDFFVEEAVQLPSTAVGAPYALALSARSDVYQEFDGGPGQIALHGLENIGGTLGTAVSHGCVRLADDAMRWLVTRIGPGVPVTITN